MKRMARKPKDKEPRGVASRRGGGRGRDGRSAVRRVASTVSRRALEPEDRDDGAEDVEDDPEQERLELMRRRYEEFLSGWAEQRDAAEADDKFLLGLNQWDQTEVMTRRRNRPTLTINKLPPAFHQIVNDIRQNAPAVKVEPDDDVAHEDVADVLMGAVRHVNGRGNAFEYKMDAVAQAVSGGWGYYGVIVDWADDTGFELDVKLRGIPNRFAVVDDPNAREPDMRDREALFLIDSVDEETFEALYENDPKPQGGMDAKIALLWSNNRVPVMEYWFREQDGFRTVATKEQDADGNPLRSREIPVYKIKMLKTNGYEVLIERGRNGKPGRKCSYTWDGRWIPFPTVFGWRMNVAGELVAQGLIRQSRDAQKSKNYAESSLIEHLGISTKSRWLVPHTAVEGFEKFWNSANTDNWPYLPYKAVLMGAGVLQPQPIPAAEPPGAILNALQAADANIRDTLGMFQGAQGEDNNDPSGYARMQRRVEADTGHRHYMNGLAIAERFEAEIILDLASIVWGGPGKLNLLGDDGASSRVDINPAQSDPANPEQDLPPGHEGRKAVRVTYDLDGVNPKGKEVKHYDLTVGRYRVRMTMGPNFATQREEQVAGMDALMQRVGPNAAAILTPFYAKAANWRDHEKIAELFTSMLPPNQQEVLKGGSGDDRAQAQQLRAQVAQMVPQLQQMGQMIQMLQGKLSDKQKDQAIKALAIAEQEFTKRLAVIGNIKTAQMQGESKMFTATVRHAHGLADKVAGHHLDHIAKDADAALSQPGPASQATGGGGQQGGGQQGGAPPGGGGQEGGGQQGGAPPGAGV
jgi:hypothetical protein